jgi:LuxR family transcriptional regulator, quorum-sensing system regulator LasR
VVQIESLYGLLNCETEADWSQALFSLARQHGFEQTLYGVVPNKQTPLEQAFLRSNYSANWRDKYDSEKLHYVDPTVGHCLHSTLPLIWQPQTFQTDTPQQEFYEEACGYGIRSGITYPAHGANGEFGVISFVSDTLADGKFQAELGRALPALALVRDFVFESSLRFALPPASEDDNVHLTQRELESLQWAMVGKSSWEISKIMCCSEATVNFHVGNVRRKFKVATRQQAVVKAIRLGLISPS